MKGEKFHTMKPSEVLPGLTDEKYQNILDRITKGMELYCDDGGGLSNGTMISMLLEQFPEREDMAVAATYMLTKLATRMYNRMGAGVIVELVVSNDDDDK